MAAIEAIVQLAYSWGAGAVEGSDRSVHLIKLLLLDDYCDYALLNFNIVLNVWRALATGFIAPIKTSEKGRMLPCFQRQ